MGSNGIQRRKVRRRLRSDWELENAPFTFEGQIEGLSRLGRGLSAAPPWMRVTAKILALTFLLPFMVYAVAWLLD
jgi:hypothetical protein